MLNTSHVYCPHCTATKVEVSLLLHDVLYPDQMVPEEGVRTEARKQWRPPQPTDSFLKVMGRCIPNPASQTLHPSRIMIFVAASQTHALLRCIPYTQT